jgi:hypothetical protein
MLVEWLKVSGCEFKPQCRKKKKKKQKGPLAREL